MIALLTYPTRIESLPFQKRTQNDPFSHRVWVLHGVIADPASDRSRCEKREAISAAHTEEIESPRSFKPRGWAPNHGFAYIAYYYLNDLI